MFSPRFEHDLDLGVEKEEKSTTHCLQCIQQEMEMYFQALQSSPGRPALTLPLPLNSASFST